MPTFTFACEYQDDEENPCEGEEEVEVEVSGGEPRTWEHPGSAPELNYELPTKCTTCNREFSKRHLAVLHAQIEAEAEGKAQEAYEDARQAAAEDRYDRWRNR